MENLSGSSLTSAVDAATALALPGVQEEEITEDLNIAVFME